MARSIRKFTKRIFITFNIIIVLFFLLACANSFLSPDNWWFVAIIGLTFPFLLLFTIAFLIFWIFFRSRWAFLSAVALVLGITNISALIGLHFGGGFKNEKEEDAIRILTWNVMWFDQQKKDKNAKRNFRKPMLEFIASQNADVLCFQEYLQTNLSRSEAFNSEKDLVRMGYPYRYFVGDYMLRNGIYTAGVAIFSRHPIVDTFLLRYPGPEDQRASESLIAADINVRGKMIRVFTTHLQSILLGKKDYRDIERIRNAEDSILDASRSILRKLKRAYAFRSDQATMVKKMLDESPYPEIICGDFNDVPNSYTYFQIRDNRRDAFLETNGGIGRTFSNISPTLRIDYILADQQFEVLQCQRKVLPYSDHYPVIADLRLKDK